MTQIIYLDDAPSQEFTLEINDVVYTFLWQYSQGVDRWSYTLWAGEDPRPLVAGRYVGASTNLLEPIGASDTLLLVVDRVGTVQSALNWYTRLTNIQADGLAPTFLVLGTKTELNALLVTNTIVDNDVITPLY